MSQKSTNLYLCIQKECKNTMKLWKISIKYIYQKYAYAIRKSISRNDYWNVSHWTDFILTDRNLYGYSCKNCLSIFRHDFQARKSYKSTICIVCFFRSDFSNCIYNFILYMILKPKKSNNKFSKKIIWDYM